MKRKNSLLIIKSFLYTFLVTLILSCSSTRTISVEEGWEILGEAKVNFIRDKDEIDVKSRNPYTAIRFYVENKDVRINYLRIYYINGDRLEPAINDEIQAGQQSRIIDLPREGREIDKIEFKYRSTGSLLKGRANVLVMGRRFDRYRY